MGKNQKINQNLENTANQRSEELKSCIHVTGAGETSTNAAASSTNVDGRVNPDNRDVETNDKADGNSGLKVGDDRDSRNH